MNHWAQPENQTLELLLEESDVSNVEESTPFLSLNLMSC